MLNTRRFLVSCRLMVIVFCYLVSANAKAEGLDCPTPRPGGAHQGFGPFDYRDPNNKKFNLPTVEIPHFPTKVATLKGGNSGTLTGDIDYTLRAFPNHHRALQSLADLAIREKKSQMGGLTFTVPCYFIRATKFTPGDGMVNAVYAYYLARIGQMDLAKSEAQEAMKKTPDNPKAVYTVGLAYFYAGDHGKAREYADKAKTLGSQAVGLGNLLSRSASKTGLNPGIGPEHR